LKKGCALVSVCNLSLEISKKKRELEYLVALKKSIQDEEVYRKSVELDSLIVQVMRRTSSQN
jgi:hypothetical protein